MHKLDVDLSKIKNLKKLRETVNEAIDFEIEKLNKAESKESDDDDFNLDDISLEDDDLNFDDANEEDEE